MEPDEGEFAYVFIDAADPGKTVRGLVTKLRDVDRDDVRVWFATDVAGAYEGFAVVQASELKQLQDFLQEELWADAKESHLEGGKGVRPAKRDTCDFLGIVRIRTKHGESQAVFETLNALVESDTQYHGVSMIFGRFDILLTLDASDMEILKSLVMGLQTMDGLEGIVRTETSFADCREL